jgi:hypothetical protein
MTTWHKGPPPSIGWWPASIFHDPQRLRWWNGRLWSIAAHSRMSVGEAAIRAHKIDRWQSHIEWTERPASWPERSKT